METCETLEHFTNIFPHLLADSPAKTSHLPSRAQKGLMAPNQAIGSGCSKSSKETDPIFASLKTFLHSELEGASGFSLAWTKRVTNQGPSWWKLVMSGPTTSGNGSGYLPTLAASEGRDCSQVQILARLDKGGRVARRISRLRIGELDPSLVVALHPSFAEELMGYPIGWTELNASEIQSFLMSRKSSQNSSRRPSSHLAPDIARHKKLKAALLAERNQIEQQLKKINDLLSPQATK